MRWLLKQGAVGQVVLVVLAAVPAASLPPDYFDVLRAVNASSSNLNVATSREDGCNLIEYSVASANNSASSVYRLADIASFLPFSAGGVPRAKVADDAFGLLLAVHHFNGRTLDAVISSSDGRALRSYEDCDVKLTAQLFDTQLSPIESTRLLTEVLSAGQQQNASSRPLPALVLGAFRSACTSPTAILSGVNRIPQVSYHASSTDFDNKEQYPYLGRTVPSSVGDANAAVAYFQRLGVSHVGVIFVTDAFGSAYQKAFQDCAGEALPTPIQTDSVSFSFSASDDEVENAILSLNNTQYRYFVAIVREEHYNVVMQGAINKGIAGDDYFWMFTSGLDRGTWQTNTARYPLGHALALATHGIAILQVEGGPTSATISARTGESSDPSVADPLVSPTSAQAKFRTAWTTALADSVLVSYFHSKLPTAFQSKPFSPEPSHHSYFIYDAIIAMGLAMCNSPARFFTGPNLYSSFTKGDNFTGVSGIVDITDNTGTRKYTTVVQTIWNARAVTTGENNDMVMFDLVPTAYYTQPFADAISETTNTTLENIFHAAARENQSETTGVPVAVWTDVPGNAFVYPDGTTSPPPVLPPVRSNYNYIGKSARIAGWTLMLVVMTLAIVTVVWTFIYRATRVVRASQPVYLVMISLGCFIMSTAIVPLSLEEPVVDYNVSGLDRACMASPWLYLSGFVFAFAALFTKTWRINAVFHHPELDSITITNFDLLATLAVLLCLNTTVLLAWTLVSPLKWDRVPKDSKDIFNRNTESYAQCSSDSSLIFAIVLIIFNLSMLLFANWQAYQAREIQTEYHESRYVAISMASILQAWCMGIPIMIVVQATPQAKFFVEAGIIFVTCTAVLLLVFVPKLIAARRDKRKESNENRRVDIRNVSARVGRHRFDDDEDYDDESIANNAMIAATAIGLDNPQASPARDNMKSWGNTESLTVDCENPQNEHRPIERRSSVRFADDSAEPGTLSAALAAVSAFDITTGEQSFVENGNSSQPPLGRKGSLDDSLSVERKDSIERHISLNVDKSGSIDSNELEIRKEAAGTLVTHNPTNEKRMAAEIKAMLEQARQENLRLKNENAHYENQLQALKQAISSRSLA